MVGMWKAFEEIERIGWMTPGRAAADGLGAGRGLRADRPGVRAGRGALGARGRTPRTVADGLRVPKAIGDFLMLRAVRESGGTALAVTDADMVDGMRRDRRAAKGSAPRPKAARRSQAIKMLVADGRIKPTESVVLFNTGGALKYLDVLRRRRGAIPRICPTVQARAPTVSRRARCRSPGRSARRRSRAARSRPADDLRRAARATMSGGWNATMCPNVAARARSSTALPPKRVARTRSKLVGAPPRCRWPSTTRARFLAGELLERRRRRCAADAAEPLGVAAVRRPRSATPARRSASRLRRRRRC